MEWVIRSADNVFLRDKAGEGLVAGEAVVTIPSAPDARTERYDAASPTKRRPATTQEITDYDLASRTARFTATSRQKDVLATCALIVRARGIPAWNALTIDQKKTAALAEADVWATIRDFIETNL